MVFPTFANTAQEQLAYYQALAHKAVRPGRFGEETQHGRFLWIAHYLTVNGYVNRVRQEDGSYTLESVAGLSGAVASQTVGSMSISWDNTSTTTTEGGDLNATIYGRQYLTLLRKYRALPFAVVGRTQRP